MISEMVTQTLLKLIYQRGTRHPNHTHTLTATNTYNMSRPSLRQRAVVYSYTLPKYVIKRSSYSKHLPNIISHRLTYKIWLL